MKLKAVLFDIDGTLLHSGGAGRKCIEDAIATMAGMQISLDQIRFHGNTDQLIFRELSARFPVLDSALIHAVRQEYLRMLPQVLAETNSKFLTDGVEDLLGRLLKRGVRLGLTTGNLERGALAKLAAFKIEHFFSFGGFAEDGVERHEILSAAISRSGLPREDILFVGDTPFDGEAAVLEGVRCVGVTTGPYGASELAESGCQLVLRSLSQFDDLLLDALNVR